MEMSNLTDDNLKANQFLTSLNPEKEDSNISLSKQDSFSLSCSKSSSVESVNVNKVLMKTKEIQEKISERLSNFLFASQNCYDDMQNEDKTENEGLKSSCSESPLVYNGSEEAEEVVYVKEAFDKILNMEKELSNLQRKLLETQENIRYTEKEEYVIRELMRNTETNINKFILEAHESRNPKCKCELM